MAKITEPYVPLLSLVINDRIAIHLFPNFPADSR